MGAYYVDLKDKIMQIVAYIAGNRTLSIGLAVLGAALLVVIIVAGIVKRKRNKVVDILAGEAVTLMPMGERCSAGEHVWARWSGDGDFYFAEIISSSSKSARVMYSDASEEDVNKKDIFYLMEAQNRKLISYGNWEGRGPFYLCNPLNLKEHSIVVQYTQDGVKEEIPYSWLMFSES